MTHQLSKGLLNPKSGPSVPGRPIILLVEDSLGEAELFAEALAEVSRSLVADPSRRPPQLIMKQTGERALEWLQSEAATNGCLPELVVVDRDLPGDAAIRFIQDIRFDSRFTRVPIVVLASTDEQADKQPCDTLGVSEFIVIPWTFDELTRLVKNLYHRWILSGRRSVGQNDRPSP